jgi:ABC-type branched-subunit amino acid transport system substrate-binding protein
MGPNDNETSTVRFAFIFDENWSWAETIIKYTIEMLNDKTDSWHDDVFRDGTIIEGKFATAACDETDAAYQYWHIRNEFDNNTKDNLPPHGVIGARCSGSSQAIALVATVEDVVQISPSSNLPLLSDKSQYPLFSRLVPPADFRGEAGALVAFCQQMKWDRVTIILTENPYSQGINTAFRELWTGHVPYTKEVAINPDTDTVNEASVIETLQGVPVKNKEINSRVIILIGHSFHVYDILKIAHERNFQPETIFVGSGAWVGNDRVPKTGFDTNSFRQGYLGVAPARNRNIDNDEYRIALNEHLMRDNIEPYVELPDVGTETLVDAILALTLALSDLPDGIQRHNGTLVTSKIRELEFNGVNGHVTFTSDGDRASSNFTIYNVQNSLHGYGKLEWVEVGYLGSAPALMPPFTMNVDVPKICWAKIGCNHTKQPSAAYKVFPTWIYYMIAIFVLIILFLVVLYRYLRSKSKKNRYKQSYQEIQSKVLSIDAKIEEAVKERERLIKGQFVQPDNWSDVSDNRVIVEVTPMDDEYWSVDARLKRDMPNAHISLLYRVQNRSLWSYYCFHKDRLSLSSVDHNEKEVWHGTSSIEPSIVYNDPHDGFMMQFARQGFWGRGIYFAERSCYSDSYSYKPFDDHLLAGTGRPTAYNSDEREMFLTTLLTGNGVKLNERDTTLVVPPPTDQPGKRYNTVIGFTGDSTVYIVYENGRAYPSYLVRYYKGNRDVKRTPFHSKEDALSNNGTTTETPTLSTFSQSSESKSDTGNNDIVVVDTSAVQWEYQDDSGWVPYQPEHQTMLEKAYQQDDTDVIIQTSAWEYKVDIKLMIQINQQHVNRRTRAVRRLLLA